MEVLKASQPLMRDLERDKQRLDTNEGPHTRCGSGSGDRGARAVAPEGRDGTWGGGRGVWDMRRGLETWEILEAARMRAKGRLLTLLACCQSKRRSLGPQFLHRCAPYSVSLIPNFFLRRRIPLKTTQNPISCLSSSFLTRA